MYKSILRGKNVFLSVFSCSLVCFFFLFVFLIFMFVGFFSFLLFFSLRRGGLFFVSFAYAFYSQPLDTLIDCTKMK